ncbi:Alpha/beta hydrolase of unknown function [Ruminococcaceae bacterium YRB3002]|nr:Alpha/beta hydrolase of unknown function [Ruminococcaceae bacterium YRB3002]
MIDLKYPVLMVHGIGFRDMKHLCYWGRIPDAIRREGIDVYFGEQDSNGTIEDNAGFLADRIKSLAARYNIDKFNVIAHSKGGLDMRYLISSLGMSNYVASLTTICTPHNGSLTVDKLMKAPKPLVKFVGGCSDLWLRICGDKKPNAYKVYRSFMTSSAEKFNEENPDVPGVYYQSYAFVCRSPISDPVFLITQPVVKMIGGENDGLLTPRDVEWTNFRGVYTGTSFRGISHCDEVDMTRMRLSGKPRKGNRLSEILDFYVDLIRELADMGF